MNDREWFERMRVLEARVVRVCLAGALAAALALCDYLQVLPW